MIEVARKRLYNAFNPDEPLQPGDPRYVDCDDVRRSTDLIQELSESIRFSDIPTCQFLSGHRGCGKTSELYRLRQLLNEDAEYFVVYCEATDYLELNDTVEYTDVLLALVQQVARDVEEKESITLETAWIASLLRDLWDELTSSVQLKDVKAKVGLLEFGFELKRNARYRQMVNDRLRPQASTFLQEVNTVLGKATSELLKSDANCKGLVVIVDNLDRMYRRNIPGTRYTSYEQLFINSSTQLKEIGCHMIYTLPPSFLHSSGGAQLPSLYASGADPQMLPMISVMQRDGTMNEAGLAKLEEIVRQRVQSSGWESGLASGFDSAESVRRLCVISGGYVRGLLSLAQQAIRGAKDVIAAEHVGRAIRARRELLVRSLDDPHWKALREVASTQKIGKSEECLQLLDNLSVLEYRDDDGVWYDVNPVIREAKEFAG